MKHIFSIHSPITFLIAHAVVDHLNLSLENVILLSNNYKVPIKKYKVAPFYANVRNSFWAKLLYPDVPNGQDAYLNKLLGNNDFTAYIDIMSYHQKSLITHEKCKNFHFIEEGNSSYRDGDDMEDLTWDKQMESFRFPHHVYQRWKEIARAMKWAYRGYTHRLTSIPYSFTSYAFFHDVRYFGFSELTFPNIPSNKREVVSLQQSPEIEEMAANLSLSNIFIWVDGSNKNFTGLPEEIYFRAIDKAINLLHQDLNGSEVYLKLRPGVKDFSNNYLYFTLSKRGYKVKVLPDNLVLECVFVNSKNCIVIGNLSSALFYASIFGHKAYSIYSLYERRVATIFDRMPAYWKEVVKLKNN